MPLLPGDIGIMKQIENERRMNSTFAVDKLEDLGPPELDWPKRTLDDIQIVIGSVLGRQFETIPREDRSLSYKLISDTATFREKLPRLVTISQLYGIFPDNTTYVDRQIASAQQSGTIKVIQVNLPNSTDMIISRDDYLKFVDNPTFAAILQERPDATWFSREQLSHRGIDSSQIAKLIEGGLMTLDPSRPGILIITVPGQGTFLKLLLSSKKWLINTLARNNKKWHELPEYQIQEKLSGMKNYWRTMRGVTLEWILYEAIGSGEVVGFQTPIGRGWKAIK